MLLTYGILVLKVLEAVIEVVPSVVLFVSVFVPVTVKYCTVGTDFVSSVITASPAPCAIVAVSLCVFSPSPAIIPTCRSLAWRAVVVPWLAAVVQLLIRLAKKPVAVLFVSSTAPGLVL